MDCRVRGSAAVRGPEGTTRFAVTFSEETDILRLLPA